MEDKIRVLVPEKDVDAKIAELGKKISEDYAGQSGASDLRAQRRRVLYV